MEHAPEMPIKAEEQPLGGETPSTTGSTPPEEVAHVAHDDVMEESKVTSVKREHAEVDASVADESVSMAEDTGVAATPVEDVSEPMAEDTQVVQGSESVDGVDKLGSEESELPLPEYLEGVDVSVVDAEQLLAFRCVAKRISLVSMLAIRWALPVFFLISHGR